MAPRAKPENPVRWLRKSLRMNQTKFAESLDIYQPRISQIEAGQPIGAELVMRIWDRYGPRLVQRGVAIRDLLAWGIETCQGDTTQQEAM